VPDQNHLLKYRTIVGKERSPPPFRNPLFRRGLLLALLNNQHWYEPMSQLFAQHPWPFFIRSQDSPKTLPWFWQDAATRFDVVDNEFKAILEEHNQMSSAEPATAKPQTPLPLLVNRLVQTYVLRKTEDKSGLRWEDFKDKKIKDEKTGKDRIAVPDAYREAKEKIASGIFLELRSRHDQAFVDHFTATFCSVKQFLPEEDFRVVAEALLGKPDTVKTLTLLALSANS
jgi:CRISPR-associated protein Cmx8